MPQLLLLQDHEDSMRLYTCLLYSIFQLYLQPYCQQSPIEMQQYHPHQNNQTGKDVLVL